MMLKSPDSVNAKSSTDASQCWLPSEFSVNQKYTTQIVSQLLLLLFLTNFPPLISLAGEAIENNTPLYGDKIVGPAIYQFQEADQLTGFGFAFFIIGLISVIESWGIEKTWSAGKMRTDVVNGDYNWDPLGLKPTDADAFLAVQTKEINNGRLAMIGVMGMLVQELVNGKGIFEFLGLEGALPAAFDTGVL